MNRWWERREANARRIAEVLSGFRTADGDGPVVGMRFERNFRVVVVLVADPAVTGGVLDALTQANVRRIWVRFERARYSLTELDRLRDEVACSRMTVRGVDVRVMASNVRSATNSVRVEIEPYSRAAAAALVARFGDALEVHRWIELFHREAARGAQGP